MTIQASSTLSGAQPGLPALAELRATFNGQVIVPGDTAYDQARAVASGIDRHPAAIIRVRSVSDVQRVVALAREHNLALAVRSGGHSSAGHGVCEGGLVLDLSAMKGLEIDPLNRTAWAEAGLTAGEYTLAASEYGLATGFGDTRTVGISGITLGGGVGYLSRKYGLTIDHLLAAEVVTADGTFLRADADSHPDLFWALRGGGGNFGVVTRFKYRLHPVDQVVGGMLILPATPETIAGFAAAAEAAPEELSTIANIMVAPPMPFLPEHVHGKLILMALMIHCGGVEAGLQAVAPFRSLAQPYADLLRPMHYPEIYPPEEGGAHFQVISHTLFMQQMDLAKATALLERLSASTGIMTIAQLRVLGGAVGRVPAGATAYAHRAARLLVNSVVMFANPAERAAHTAWCEGFAAALHQGERGAYVNFLGDEGPERVRAAYPGHTWERLVEIKRRYDPNNLFRLNQNIPPEG